MIQSGSGSEANKRATLEQSPFTFLVEYYVATPHPKDRMYVRACDCVCVLVSFLFLDFQQSQRTDAQPNSSDKQVV